jgi:hypothetical protein
VSELKSDIDEDGNDDEKEREDPPLHEECPGIYALGLCRAQSLYNKALDDQPIPYSASTPEMPDAIAYYRPI